VDHLASTPIHVTLGTKSNCLKSRTVKNINLGDIYKEHSMVPVHSEHHLCECKVIYDLELTVSCLLF
jgi:hypothetical protein